MPDCDHCDRSFVDKQALRMHTESKHSDHELPECGRCYRSFVNEQALRMHTESKHPGYECTYCDRMFSTSDGRDMHVRTKHIHCSICNREFSSQVALDQHEEAKHPSYECSYCDKEFASDDARIQHQNAKHAPGPPTAYTPSYPSSLPSSSWPPAVKPAPLFKQESTTESFDGDGVLTQLPEVPKEIKLFADSLGAIEPMAVEDSLVDACNLDVAMESQEVTDPSADHNVPVHAMDSQDEQPLLEPERKVDGERYHDLTPAHLPLPPRDKDNCRDPSTCLSEVALNLEEEPSNTNLQSGFARMECDTVPCDLDVLEQNSTPDAHAVVQDLGIFEHTRPTQPDIVLDLVNLPSQDHNMSPPEASNDQPMVLDIDMSHEEVGGPLECDSCVPGLEPDNTSPSHSTESLTTGTFVSTTFVPTQARSAQFIGCPPVCASELEPPAESGDSLSRKQIDGPLEYDPCVPGLEPDSTSSSHSTELLANGTFALGIRSPVQARSPQFIGSSPVGTSALEPPAESGDPFIRNLVPSPTPSEHGSVKPPSITQDDHSHHSGSRPLLSPLTSEGSPDYFSDADRSSSPSSPLSDHSVVFVSAESIPEYVRENRAYLVATSAPSRPSSATSSCVHLPSVVTSLDDRAEVSPADSPSTNGPSPLYCRICLRDPCDDSTATMCGHIFCNRCIIDAVMARSACPVCNAPTLLYCLFRLDI